MSQMSMIQAIRSAHDVMLEKDPSVIAFGQDIGYFGGVFRCTDGLQKKYGDHRVIDQSAVEAIVDACMLPLLEIEHGLTTITVDPEKGGKKIPVTEAFAKMGGAYRHLTTPEYAGLAAEVQAEVDRRWNRLKALADSELL